ncbi:acyltransferase [Chlorogloeopsis sp. ULAP01]|uniref:acyltransferase n=1 Tax=Chlorogloeopsis sp. ULAP01 TaxID=3056483 RepID=UPI0025AAB43E|nr:acyltransferase [Chlorogloeopsis sp. ULAP01]MDM9379811.1 acyltransferase [Chlorogloeopsis sp. ULAP01]
MDTREFTGEWDYSTLPDNIWIEPGCYLERKESFQPFRSQQNPGLILGKNVQVYTWTVFSVEPEGKIVVGNDSTLVGAVFWCAESITVGRRVLISYNVTIADSDFHPRDPDLRRLDAIAIAPNGDHTQRPPLVTEPVVIADDVQIGIGAIILKGVQIAAGARIGAGSVVTSNVPAGAFMAGNPAREVRR